jgi:hypothetical protein
MSTVSGTEQPEGRDVQTLQSRDGVEALQPVERGKAQAQLGVGEPGGLPPVVSSDVGVVDLLAHADRGS